MKSIFFRKIFPVKKLPGRDGVKKAHPSGLKDLVWKAGRTTERTTFTRMMKKYPGSSAKAYKVAQQKGVRKVASLGKRLGVEGLGVGGSIKTIKKFKPSKYKTTHFDDPNLAYSDMPQIIGRASAERKDIMNQWGFKPRNRRFFKVQEKVMTGPIYKTDKGKKVLLKYKGSEIRRTRKTPKYIKHKNLSAWTKSGYKTYKE